MFLVGLIFNKKMKILVVKYLPSGENSNTKVLLEAFLEVAGQKIGDLEIENVDLLKKQPPFFNLDSMQAYYKRNYGGNELNEAEKGLLAGQDELKNQLKAADLLVIACPMHNFGLPALVKGWLDAVIMKGETFDYGKKMMAGKRALALFTSGGEYSHDKFDLEYPNWDALTMLAKVNFGFMGFDKYEVLGASLRDESKKEAKLAEIRDGITKFLE